MSGPRRTQSSPGVIIADTVKGAGCDTFASTSMRADEWQYRFHSGAPSPDDYREAHRELVHTVEAILHRHELPRVQFRATAHRSPVSAAGERLPEVYGRALVERAHSDHANRGPRRRPSRRHRAPAVQRAIRQAVCPVWHRRAGHGVARRRMALGAWFRSCTPSRASCTPAPTSRSTTTRPSGEGPLRRLARGRGSRRSRPLAPVGARHLGAGGSPRNGADRAVLRARVPRRRRLGGESRAGPGLHPPRQRRVGGRIRAARRRGARPGARNGASVWP